MFFFQFFSFFHFFLFYHFFRFFNSFSSYFHFFIFHVFSCSTFSIFPEACQLFFFVALWCGLPCSMVWMAMSLQTGHTSDTCAPASSVDHHSSSSCAFSRFHLVHPLLELRQLSGVVCHSLLHVVHRSGQSRHLVVEFHRFPGKTISSPRLSVPLSTLCVSPSNPFTLAALDGALSIDIRSSTRAGIGTCMSLWDCPAPAFAALLRTDLGLNCHSRLQDSRELETQIWLSLTPSLTCRRRRLFVVTSCTSAAGEHKKRIVIQLTRFTTHVGNCKNKA